MTEIQQDEAPEIPAPSTRRASGVGGRPRRSTGALAMAAVFALLLGGALAAGLKPLRFGQALRDLGSGKPAEREAARERLLSLRDYATPRLGRLAEDPSGTQRLKAVRAIRVLGLAEETPRLNDLALKDPETGIREEAIRTLGELGTAGSETALKALLDLAEGAPSEWPVLGETLAALSPSAEGPRKLLRERALKALGKTPHPLAGVRLGTLEAAGLILAGSLGEGAPPPDAIPLFQAAILRLADADPAVRRAAGSILDQVRGGARSALAVASLAHEDAWVRLWSESALRQASGTSVGHDPLAPGADRAQAQDAWRKVATP